jgi:pimeloyl-ACP methyl ester carboxylesterase
VPIVTRRPCQRIGGQHSNLTQANGSHPALTSLHDCPSARRIPVSPPAAPRNWGTPTVLLLHGAFSDASVWTGVIEELQAAGIEALAPANPLRGLASDAAYLASVAGEIDGPVILAGHGYGGAVITAAGSAPGNVTGLVYVAGFAVDQEESTLDITARFPGGMLLPALRPASFPDANGEQRIELYLDRAAFPGVFGADLPGHLAAAAAAAQRPIAAGAVEEKSSAAAWKTLPCWYVIASADEIIPAEAQRFMAVRAGARSIEVSGSHAIPLSQPAAVARHIAAAASSHDNRPR